MYLFQVADKDGYIVSLTQTRWDVHIVERRPELAECVPQIQEVIQNPQIITRDTNTGSYLLSRLGVVQGKWANLYLEVVVRYDEDADPIVGTVLTVYFNDRIPKGDLRWFIRN